MKNLSFKNAIYSAVFTTFAFILAMGINVAMGATTPEVDPPGDTTAPTFTKVTVDDGGLGHTVLETGTITINTGGSDVGFTAGDSYITANAQINAGTASNPQGFRSFGNTVIEGTTTMNGLATMNGGATVNGNATVNGYLNLNGGASSQLTSDSNSVDVNAGYFNVNTYISSLFGDLDIRNGDIDIYSTDPLDVLTIGSPGYRMPMWVWGDSVFWDDLEIKGHLKATGGVGTYTTYWGTWVWASALNEIIDISYTCPSGSLPIHCGHQSGYSNRDWQVYNTWVSGGTCTIKARNQYSGSNAIAYTTTCYNPAQ